MGGCAVPLWGPCRSLCSSPGPGGELVYPRSCGDGSLCPPGDLYCRACCAPGRACMLPYWRVLTALEWAVKTSVDFCLPVAAYIKIACVSLPHALTRLAFCMTSGLGFNLRDHLCHSLCKTFSDPVCIGVLKIFLKIIYFKNFMFFILKNIILFKILHVSNLKILKHYFKNYM